MAENDNPRAPRVGWSDIADARARLRAAGIGLPDLSVTAILHEPLGPETLCLSATEVSEIIANGSLFDSLSPRDAHVVTCGACQEALDLFRQITQLRRRNPRITFKTIEIPRSRHAFLGIEIANFGDARVLTEMCPGSVIVEASELRARGGEVADEITPPLGAQEATLIRFRDYETRLVPGQQVQNASIRLTGITRAGEVVVSRGYVNLFAV